jgi:dolichyl-diphosphooligosaccharide--protein glycosyltransferase
MKKLKYLKIALPILMLMGISVLLRVVLPYNQIFSEYGIKYACNDAYYHMRIVDNLVANFPHLTYYDPYFIVPNGTFLFGEHFFDWLLAGIVWLVGLGNPTAHTIDIVGIYFPVILAALVIIPTYFVGKTLFNKYAGLVASALVAILPGEFMGRSLLGATDHHVAETLFSTVMIMFFILAIKAISKKRQIIFSALCGIFLGIYLLTWTGGLLFILIMALYYVVQAIVDHIQNKASFQLTSLIIFPIALIMNYWGSLPKISIIIMVFVEILPVLLFGLSKLMRNFKGIFYPLTIIGFGLLIFLFVYFITPSFMDNFAVFISSGASSDTTSELQPFFYPSGTFTADVAWGNYTMSLFLAPISFLILMWMYIKRKEKSILFFLTWTLVIAVLTLIQRRYSYYLVVNVSVIMGYLIYVTYKGLGRLFKWIFKIRKVNNKRYIGLSVYILVVFFVVFFPNYNQDKETSRAPFTPSNAWQSALLWMKDNTPSPFNNEETYYTYYGVNPYGLNPLQEDIGKGYIKPSYAVTSWWDYGYWITRIAHRIPNTNPAQQTEPIKKVAELLLDEENNIEIINEFQTKYIIIDYSLVTGKFYAMAEWIDKNSTDYMDVFYVYDEGVMKQVELFSIAYYKTLAVRLFNFDGKAVSNEQPMVVTYVDKVTPDGYKYKQVTNYKMFKSYAEALSYSQSIKGSLIVGLNPFVSPIPLEALDEYKLVYSSTQQKLALEAGGVPEVKIFEYLGAS